MLTPELENELLDHYSRELRAKTELFTRTVAGALQHDPEVADEVRPLVVWRVKTPKSLRRKLRATFGPGKKEHEVRTYPLSPQTLVEYVQDLGGVRVIVHDRSRVDTMVELLKRKVDEGSWIHYRTKVFAWDRDLQEVGELDDDVEVAWGQRGSYRSRHIVVGEGAHTPIRCEVQFRSVIEEAMFEANHRLIYRPRQEGREPSPQAKQTLGPLTEMFTAADDLVSDCYRWTAQYLKDQPGGEGER